MSQNPNQELASQEAERSALSAALIFPDHAMPVLLTLVDTDFSNGWNRTIFRAMKDTWEQSHDAMDMLSLREVLRNRNVQDNVIAYLDATYTYEPSAMMIERYVDTIKDRARRRRILEGFTPLVRSLHDIEVPIERIVDQGKSMLQEQIPPDTSGTTAEQGAISVLAKANYYYANPISNQETRGINTGYYGLNTALDGWKRGYVYYVLGLEHSGKTTFAINCAMKICERGGRAVVFSLEQSVDASEDPERSSLWERIVLSQANVATRTYQTGNMHDTDYNSLLDAGERVSHWNLTMYDDVRTIPEMEAACLRVGQEGPIDLVVIDYLKLIEQPGSRYGTRNEEIGGLTRKLKRMGLSINVPLMVPHQVSSKAIASRNEKRIQLSDAYESGHLSQDADVVLGLNRDELFNDNTENPNIMEVDVLKDRITGGTGASVDLFFNKRAGRIHNVYADPEQQPGRGAA